MTNSRNADVAACHKPLFHITLAIRSASTIFSGTLLPCMPEFASVQSTTSPLCDSVTQSASGVWLPPCCCQWDVWFAGRDINVLGAVNKDTITRGLRYSIATGNWGMQGQTGIRPGVSQVTTLHMLCPKSLSHSPCPVGAAVFCKRCAGEVWDSCQGSIALSEHLSAC